MKDDAPSRAVRKRSGAIPTERNLVDIVSELRRLNRTITVPLERDLKRAGCPSLERYEVLREIDASGKVRIGAAELQTRLAVPRRRMSQLIDGLAKDGYAARETTASDIVVITASGRRALRDASAVITAVVRRFFYGKRRL